MLLRAKPLFFVFIVFIVSLVFASISGAKPEYAKKEGKSCAYCHVKAGSKELNDTGKCYQKNSHSLNGCEDKKK